MAVNNGSALALGRSPHGERGLKYVGQLHGLLIGQVALLMESVD